MFFAVRDESVDHRIERVEFVLFVEGAEFQFGSGNVQWVSFAHFEVEQNFCFVELDVLEIVGNFIVVVVVFFFVFVFVFVVEEKIHDENDLVFGNVDVDWANIQFEMVVDVPNRFVV